MKRYKNRNAKHKIKLTTIGPMNTCPKSDKHKIYAKGNKYLHVENIIKYSVYRTHFRTETMSSQ